MITWSHDHNLCFFFNFSGVNSCPPGGHCSTHTNYWEDRNQRFCKVAQSFSWPLVSRRWDDSNVAVINITVCRIKHRVFPWEKYPAKSHPETSDFLHFSEDMCVISLCNTKKLIANKLLVYTAPHTYPRPMPTRSPGSCAEEIPEVNTNTTMCQSKECWLLSLCRIVHTFFSWGSGFFPLLLLLLYCYY